MAAPPEGPTALWLRGLLDVCLLAVLENRPLYGYEMTRRLAEEGLDVVAEGSIYLALARMEKAGLVSSFRQPSLEGPPPKYYELSEPGAALLRCRRLQWDDFSRAVLGREGSGERRHINVPIHLEALGCAGFGPRRPGVRVAQSPGRRG